MRNLMLAGASAAVLMLAAPNMAFADGWADSTAYRELSWSGSTSDTSRRSARNDSDDDEPRQVQPRRRKVAQVEVQADDEDRPQRRNRTARANRGSVGGGSVASNESGGTTGMASFYWQPQRVASGGWFNPNAMTAAHKTLPFGTRVRVHTWAMASRSR
ncbi:MAG: septal ring lytic transglycosylase RlpA family protein [Hyphomicrobiaceae bacterium]